MKIVLSNENANEQIWFHILKTNLVTSIINKTAPIINLLTTISSKKPFY